ncbi:MAG: hypothetical protein F9K37_01910 [Bacteroidales bacterium]|nr:MAG: hypothetical protein F9K37_01910 [Bacteroidales bacterium]
MDIFDEYRKIALKRDFEFGSSIDESSFIIPSDRMVNRKYCYLIKGDLMYFASDSYAARVGLSSTFSGIYTPIQSVLKDFEAEMSKHFWFDFIAGGSRVKTGNSYIDKHLRVKTNMANCVSMLVDVRVVDSYLKLWDKYSPLKIVVGPKYLPFIKGFEDKLVIGVEATEWIKPERFEVKFDDFKELLLAMKRKVEKNYGD